MRTTPLRRRPARERRDRSPTTYAAVPSPTRRAAAGLTLIALTMICGVTAQTPNPPTSATPPAGEAAPVSLTPFEVTAEKDTGYLAQNTASGSRLNTSLLDTPGAISVFTAEFLQDIGATDIEQLSEYVMNTDRDLGFLRETPQGNNFATQDRSFRVRGISTDLSGGRSVNFFRRTLEMDTFNTERVEFSRGPNSILFGQSTAGTFNTQTKKADPRRRRYELSFRTGSYEQIRAAFDVNLPLVPDRAAIRVNAVDDTKNSWRPHEFKDQRRWHVSTHFKLTLKTTLDLEWENLRIAQSLHRPWLAFDSITGWLALGQQIDPAAGTPIPASAGLTNISAANWYSFDTTTGQIWNFRNQSRSAATGPTALKDRKMLYEFNLVPRTTALFGPGIGADIDGDLYSAFLRHEVVPRLHVELAYNRQTSAYLGRDIDQNEMQVVFDTNAQLPNGQPNPNVRRPYIDAEWFTRERFEEHDDGRVTASYEFDLGKWFGKHRVAGLAEQRIERTKNTNAYEIVVQNPPNLASPELLENRLHRRTYFDLNGPVALIAAADFRGQPIVGVLNRSNNLPLTSGFAPSGAGAIRDDRYETTTGLFVSQSRFWRDRLVITFGYREDEIAAYRSTAVRGAPVAPFTQGAFIAVAATTPEKKTGSTRTQGAVFHATKNLSLFYNQSSSFNTPDRTRQMFPRDPLPAPEGRGQDLGAKLRLLDGKVFVTATYYETKVKRESDNLNPATVTNPINTIWNTLNNAGVLRANTINFDDTELDANGYVRDSSSTGLELELVANLTPHWRLSLNGSDNRTITTNVAKEVTGYRAQWWPFFLQGDRARMVINSNGTLAAQAINPNDGQNTIAEQLATVDSFIDDEFVRQEGANIKGFPRYQANVRTNYTFTREKLRGLGLGDGARWRQAPTIGYTAIDPAVRRPIKGSELFLVDFNASYRRRVTLFRKNVEWMLQLNVNNVLNEDDITVVRA
jgi:iron complex outermembrane receptor protein